MTKPAIVKSNASKQTSRSASNNALGSAEIWSGIAAAAVVLPQAMAFGVALLTPLGLDPAIGAVAGLIGAAALCIGSGLAGGTQGLISAPTGPVLVLLGGALANLDQSGLHGSQLLTALAAVLILTGIFQSLIGLSGGGRLIKFMPYPVVAGFMTGSAILMIMSQMKSLTAGTVLDSFTIAQSIPAVTAITTLGIVTYTPRILPAIPGTISGLIGGSLIFQGLLLFTSQPVPEAWIIGLLPGPETMHFGISLTVAQQLPWWLIIFSALALAVLASLDTLLTAVIADIGTGVRHNARRELVGQGIGQIIAGLFGGIAGAGTTGATLVAVKTGGRRWAGLGAGLSFVVLLLVGGPLGHVLPLSVLAGIILHVALGMLDRDIIAWIRYIRTRMDAGIAIFVTIVTVSYDLMVAVGIGVLIAVILFIRAQVKSSVIHRRSTCAQLRPVRHRTDVQRELLDKHGDRVILYELRGNLFFATADQLFEEISADLNRPAWIILHMRRIQQVDFTGVKILQQIADRLHAHGGHLLFCNVHKQIGLGKKVRRTLQKISASNGDLKVKTFNGSDEAVEYAENKLLSELGSPAHPSDKQMSLGEMDFCAAMTAGQIHALEQVLLDVKVDRHDKVFACGDEGAELYIVSKGEVDIRLPTSKHHYMRLAKYGPGTLFGEIAFLNPGARTADAIAVLPSHLKVLDRSGFERLEQQDSDAAIAVLFALGVAQGNHLRWSVAEIRRWAQW